MSWLLTAVNVMGTRETEVVQVVTTVLKFVIDGPTSVVFPQAANRLPTEQAVPATLVDAG
ncbi:MAG TPA: hypothetical protein VHE08_08115 [Solirubrobacterales bacterium]|nr:hypothetical protein [Solirubrobacterales bacterium]